jgi:hypothetical protein
MPDSKKPELRIDWATHDAAKYACENWHYSRCVPKSKLAKFGVWEDGEFIGCVIYGVGATSALVKGYGLKPNEGCELVRVALRRHKSPVSKILAISTRLLKAAFADLRLVVSFADPTQGHHGGIYQASGWVFAGNSQASDEYIFKGKRWQGRAFRNKYKGMERHPSVQIVKGSSKHRYLMPLDADMRQRIAPLSKPYPKRPKQATDGHPPSSGGATPTRTLQHSEPVNVPA